jgi:hypothetical protein
MRFRRYARGSIIADSVNVYGDIALKTTHRGAGGLLRTVNGIPITVIDRGHVADVAALFECMAKDLDQAECAKLGVEVVE